MARDPDGRRRAAEREEPATRRGTRRSGGPGRRRDPVPRARDAWNWLGGILLLGVLGGGVVVAGVLLWENLDVRRLVPELDAGDQALPRAVSPAPPAAERRTFRAAILRSGASAEYFPDSSFHPRELDRWEALVRAVGGEVRRIDTAALESLEPAELLVVVESPCLSRGDRRGIRRHLASGGSVVANGAAGARDEGCGWRGWDFVAEMTGSDAVREIDPSDALFLTVPAGIALSPGIDPGTRVELRPDPSMAVALPGPHAYWSDWALNPRPLDGSDRAGVAVVSRETEAAGRLVWFGFRASQAVTPSDAERVRVLLRNGIRWSAGLASAAPAPWPYARRAALVVAQEVEAEARNALPFADLVEQLELPVSFFAVSRLVLEDRALGRRLEAVGEVGSQTPDHRPLAGLGHADQLVRLRRARSDIEGWSGTAPTGLRPPEEAFDENTLHAWAEAGGEYLLAAAGARTASPELHETGDGPVVVLPRLVKDDYNVVVQDASLSSGALEEAWLDGLDKLRAIGGLAAVVSHTQILDRSRRTEAIRAVADRARRQRDWWIVSGRDAARWWRARSAVTVRFDDDPGAPGSAPRGDSGAAVRAQPDGGNAGGREPPIEEGDTSVVETPLRLRVTLPRAVPTGAIWIDVVLPHGRAGRVPVVDGRPVEFVETEWGIRVPVQSDPDVPTERLVALVRPERP